MGKKIVILVCNPIAHDIGIRDIAEIEDFSTKKVLPVLVDLNVSETKVTGSAIGTKDNSSEAIKNALDAANADVLMEPQFTVEVNGNAAKITGKGYLAKYENFKSAEPSDIDNTAVKQGNVQVVKPQPVAEQPKKKGGVIWAIISSIAGGVVAVATTLL